jgi:hypothetical protein
MFLGWKQGAIAMAGLPSPRALSPVLRRWYPSWITDLRTPVKASAGHSAHLARARS